MKACEFTYRVGAYHDGELPEGLDVIMAGHVGTCAACRAELDALQSVSELFRAEDSRGLTPMELARIQARFAADRASEDPPLRLFGGLMAAAASILVVCGAWWLEAPKVPPRGSYVVHETAAWERVAMNLRTDPEPLTGREATALADPNLADWMMDGLNNREFRRESTQD